MVYGVGTFNGTDDALRSGQIFKGFDGFVVLYGNVLGPAAFVQMGVLRPDTRIVEAGRNGIYFVDLPLVILAENRFHAVEDTDAAFGNRRGVEFRVDALAGSFAADEPYRFVADEVVEHAHGIAAAADAGQHGCRKLSFPFQNLRPRFLADDGLEVADHHREGMGPHGRTDDVMRVVYAADPFAHRFVDRILEDLRSRGDGVDLRAQQLHAVYVQGLPYRIFFAHKDFAFQAHKGRGRRRRHAVLAGPRFGNNPRLAHLFRQQALAQGVVDLMGSRMIQVFPFQINFCAAQVFRHLAGVVQQRRPVGVIIQQVL